MQDLVRCCFREYVLLFVLYSRAIGAKLWEPGALSGLPAVSETYALACRNPACMNMCSKCYREQISEQEKLAANGKTAAAALNASRMDMGKPDSPVLPAPVPAALEPQSAPEPAKAEAEVSAPDVKASEPAAVASSSAERRRPVQLNTGRCFTCRKKIGLTGFQCRCEYFFCAQHR